MTTIDIDILNTAIELNTAKDTMPAVADIIAGALSPASRAAAVANTLREAGRAAADMPLYPWDLKAGLICLEGHYALAGDPEAHLASTGGRPPVVADLSDPAVAARAKTVSEMVLALRGLSGGGTIANCAKVWRAMASAAASRAEEDPRSASIAATWAREAAMLEAGLLLTGEVVEED